jgi:5-methylcytosine-specific restriction protein B
MDTLLENESLNLDLLCEELGIKIHRKMLYMYLDQTIPLSRQWLADAMKLCVGFKHEDKIKILKNSGVSDENLVKVSKYFEDYDILVKNTFNNPLNQSKRKLGRSSTISTGAIRTITDSRGNADITLLPFLEKTKLLLSDIIALKDNDTRIVDARRLYLKAYTDIPFPINITTTSIGNLLYTLSPEAFPLTNSFVLDRIQKSINKKFKNNYQGYIDFANSLDVVLAKLETTNFMLIDRLASLAPELLISSISSKNSVIPLNKNSLIPLNQILFGPPGTGKTYNTVHKALEIINPENLEENKDYDMLKGEFDSLVAENQIKFVTFHQSYGYEEFVEGIKPKTINGQVTYPLENGVFKNICIEAEKQPEKPFVLIIDEINRGNISKIFGELITLIEPSKRSGDDQVEAISLVLPSSGLPFSVPNNVYIIGTMNTADRSLTMIDTALRRRFDFIEMMPDASLLKGNKVEGIDLCLLLEIINKRIEVLYDREHTLGHAFFMPRMSKNNKNNEKFTFEELKKAFKNKILPLLEEYFFEDWEKIRLVLGDNQKSDNEKFILKSNVNYSELFGANNTLSAHEQSSNSFALKPFDDEVWENPEAYQQIYAPLNKEQTSESEYAS